jgi:demethylmenaquinone methyltransferase/2-methoxy-6-polyprenyl-1,4-benzoquinol methylase
MTENNNLTVNNPEVQSNEPTSSHDTNKQQKIVTMFNDIAKTYDLANRILSFGIDKIWRKRGCDLAYTLYEQETLSQIIDVACGTGDMCDYWMKRAAVNGIALKNITGVDPSEGMLAVAKEKLPYLEFLEGKATELPFEANQADIVSISYGIRNVVQRQEAFEEFHRVLKPGGLLVILEFTKNEQAGIGDWLREFYMKKILPFVGKMISKHKDAYDYLPNSIDGFATTQKLQNELELAGFEPVMVKGFSLNISTLFIFKKI